MMMMMMVVNQAKQIPYTCTTQSFIAYIFIFQMKCMVNLNLICFGKTNSENVFVKLIHVYISETKNWKIMLKNKQKKL